MKKDLLSAKLLILGMILTLTVGLFLILCLLTGCSNKTDNKNATPTDATSTDVVVEDIPVTEGDFIYKNDKKTEIIGLSEDGSKTLELIFPENVTKISNVYVTSESLLKKVYFLNPDVEIENVSFANSGVEIIYGLPTTITTIPDNFLNGCTNLVQLGDTPNVITIPDNITEIGEGAFSGCSAITTVDFNKVTTIKGYAFQGCSNLTTVTWNNVKTIGDGAFFGAGFTELSLSDSVTDIGGLSFFRCESLTKANINNVETVGEKAFDGCATLTDFTSNKDFDVVSSENEGDLFDDLFDKNATITLHLVKNSKYVEYLTNHPNTNITIAN